MHPLFHNRREESKCNFWAEGGAVCDSAPGDACGGQGLPRAVPRRPWGGMQARGGKGAPVPFPQGGYGKTAPTFREGGQDVDKVGRLAER